MSSTQLLSSIGRFLCSAACLAAFSLATEARAQTSGGPDPSLYQGLQYRSIGPFRGGRSCAVTGIPGRPMDYYFGATGGGVWKTNDGGASWENISDGFFGGSIGSIAVAPSDHNVMYVGGGEKTVRGNVSHGYGMWKSLDGGESWESIGLEDSRHIPRIRVHPKDPDTVYVAVMGHLYGPNQQRGVYRSTDGGQTWERILFVNDEVGAVDLILDPENPRVIYATTWRILRTPYSLESGGEGSGIWKSTDGGDHWTEITRNPGLPQGTVGISGIAVSPVNTDRVWAIVEAQDGGVFRSENAGDTWRRVNDDRNLRQRAWYYTRIYAGPQNEDEVYVLNVAFWRSGDGGVTFDSIRTPHSDHHDLWIDPDNADRMIVGDDGGAQVSFNRGETWSDYYTQPTAQFYRVTTDNHFPYRIYGAQQDNSTVRILHRSSSGTIGERDWEPTAGGESGHIAPDPDDPEIVYGGSYGGFLMRLNHATGEARNINVWPDNPMGHGAGDLRYRFQWNFPIFFSPHDSDTLYTAANVLFKSTNEGQNWIQISPDLTRNDPSKLGPSGGPITKDNTGVEYYCTIFAALESPHEPGVLWTGSDDGLVHLSRDGGESWNEVTPPTLPEWSQINSMEAHPTEPGGLYLAATRYKLDDFKPYLYRTLDYGESWQRIDRGIDRKHFTRVVRADPDRAGLLYAGTESGIHISFDDGENWAPFQLNLPVVPITDLALKNQDLIVATQGRSFWVLDDLTPLHQMTDDVVRSDMHLFEPRATYRLRGGGGFRGSRTAGQNPPSGVVLHFLVDEVPQDGPPLELDLLDDTGEVIQQYSTSPGEDVGRLEVESGLNRMVWSMRYPGAETFPGLVLWGGGTQGPRAAPGTYHARLRHGEEEQTVSFEILADPRISATQEDLEAQFQFLREVRDKLTEVHVAILEIRDLQSQIDNLTERIGEDEEMADLVAAANELRRSATAIEEALYQTRNESPQDPLNYPIRLNNRLSALASVVSMGDNPPTDQAVAFKNEITVLIDEQLSAWETIKADGIPAFNQMFREKQVPAVILRPQP